LRYEKELAEIQIANMSDKIAQEKQKNIRRRVEIQQKQALKEEQNQELKKLAIVIGGEVVKFTIKESIKMVPGMIGIPM